jgi:predicted CoA-substrate-specific enzyme activase
MMTEDRFYAGIDVGTSYVKAVLIDSENEVLGSALERSGADLTGSIQSSFDALLGSTGLSREDIVHITATGFGRRNAAVADDTRTEIGCHARGAYHHFPRRITIVDIGGQDTKVIKVDDTGRRVSFKMNRKCAAGTGAFLEEIAHKMDIGMDEMNDLAVSSSDGAALNSYCTVFASSEILTRIREGERIEDMVRSAFESVAKRVIEMDPLNGTIVATGGVVAHNSIMLEILSRHAGSEVLAPPSPQLSGALGAALFARDVSA